MNLEEILDQLPPMEREEILRTAMELIESENREKAQKEFMEFAKSMWPGFINGRHHKVMAKKFQEIAEGKIKRLIVNMPPRHAIMVDMKIPTTNGMKLMSDLIVGDFVFGPDGLPVEVIGKSDVFKNRELYRVWTDDNAYIDVDGEHLWTVRLDRKTKVYKDYTTEQLWRRQNGEFLRTKRNGVIEFLLKKIKTPRLPRLPDVSPVQYKRKNLLIDPYVLGVWLGDGSKGSGVITSKDDDAFYIRPEIEKRGYKTTNQNTKYTFGILGLQAQLKQLGIYKNKHIPREYLEASIDQRKDLLKGLMDTDGNVSKEGQCFFAQSNFNFFR
jgi:intein/homing endonuclease